MSLLVWLPLMGNYNNQGLSGNIPFTETGTVSNTTGKIGTCKSFSSSNSIGNYDFTLGDEASLTFWMNASAIPSGTTAAWLIDLASSSGYANAVLGIAMRGSNIVVGIGGNYNQNVAHGFVTDKWYNVAVVWKNPITYLYINGSLHQIYTDLSGGTKLTSTKISLASNAVGTTSSRFTGKFNDVRVYDHALSVKEIKEISKGLVLHYPMCSQNIIDKSTLSEGCYINSSGSEKATNNWYATDYIPVVEDHTYRTSKLSTGGSNTYIGIYDSSKVKTRTILMVADEDNLFAILPGESYVRLSIRNVAGELADSAFYDTEDITYDCSGYSYNGEIYGDINIERLSGNESPRHTNNMYKSNDGSYVSIPTAAMTYLSDCSISFWFYIPEWKTSYETLFQAGLSNRNWYGYIFGFLRVSSGNNMCFTISDGTNSSGHYTSSSCDTGTIELNKWNHVAMVYTSGNMKVYINGELVNDYTTTVVPNFAAITRIRIGTATDGAYDSEVGISDFRIYSTPISGDDVKSLYNVGESIDRNGNIWAYEFDEKDSGSTSFMKNGCIESVSAIENTVEGNAGILSNDVHANQLLEV